MSLLENVASHAVGSLKGNGGQFQGDALKMVMALLTQGGGVEGVVRKFAQHGLGDLARKWVGHGSNPPITGEQFTQVFGAVQVNQLAQQMGLAADQAAQGLAAMLPTVIDKLTPDGKSVSGGDLECGVFRIMGEGTQGLGLGDLTKLFRTDSPLGEPQSSAPTLSEQRGVWQAGARFTEAERRAATNEIARPS
jgi:uncharacterized protein YidB (DUF937 family)